METYLTQSVGPLAQGTLLARCYLRKTMQHKLAPCFKADFFLAEANYPGMTAWRSSLPSQCMSKDNLIA